MIDLGGKVLVVVDMERSSGYRRSMTENQVRTVEVLISEAVRVDSFVIFLEFLDEGTLRRLLRCVRGYDMFVRQEKEGNRWDEFPQATNLRLVSVVIDEEVEDEEAA